MSVIERDSSSLQEAMELNLAGHVAWLPMRVSGMLVEHGDVLLVDSGLDCDTFNKILHARLHPRDADEAIGRAVEHFRNVDRAFTWWVGPGSRPLDLEERLGSLGLAPQESERGMSLDLGTWQPDGVPPEGFAVRRVRSRDDLEAYASILAALWEPPDGDVVRFHDLGADLLLSDGCPMRLYLGLVEGIPAATCELFLDEVAGLHGVATAKEFRGRGLATALVRHVLGEAREAGAVMAVLQASVEGEGVYARLGFVPGCRFVEYALVEWGSRS